MDLRTGLMGLYREHIMQAFGNYNAPNVGSAEVMLEVAKRIKVPQFEAEQGWRTEPPFPGSTPGPEHVGTIWRLVCACRVLSTKDNSELAVLYTTLAGGRPPAVVPNPPGTHIPEEYLPLASR